MKARIDFERCTGHGRCYALCPEVFAEDDNGYPVLDDSPIPDDLAARVRRAADNCPESAITLLSPKEDRSEESSSEESDG
jgi:ferredoxin